MNSVRLYLKEACIGRKKDFQVTIVRGDLEDIRILHQISFIDGILSRNQARLSGRGDIDAGVSKGTGHQRSHIGAIHIDIENAIEGPFLPFLHGTPDLAPKRQLQ